MAAGNTSRPLLMLVTSTSTSPSQTTSQTVTPQTPKDTIFERLLLDLTVPIEEPMYPSLTSDTVAQSQSQQSITLTLVPGTQTAKREVIIIDNDEEEQATTLPKDKGKKKSNRPSTLTPLITIDEEEPIDDNLFL